MVPQIDTNRTVSGENDTGELMLDLYKAYKECGKQLKAIKVIDDKYFRG